MGSVLALAGQGAANQVFTTFFWILSFLPAVVTPLIAQAKGAKDVWTCERCSGGGEAMSAGDGTGTGSDGCAELGAPSPRSQLLMQMLVSRTQLPQVQMQLPPLGRLVGRVALALGAWISCTR